VNFTGDIMSIEELVGKTCNRVKENGDEIYFYCTDGTSYKLYHDQDCCEVVYIDDIVGDLIDLVGTPILSAQERSNEGKILNNAEYETFTWTFYRLSTIKGTVVLKFYGTSNGCYSEKADLIKL